MNDSPPDDILTWDNLIYIADLLEISNHKKVSLLGGEPFLHPDIIEFVLYLLKRKIHVNIFTSGVISEKIFKEAKYYLKDLDNEGFSIICNINNFNITTRSELKSIKRFLACFGHLTTAGFNIYRDDFEIDFLFQLINEFGLGRQIRFGIAHPIPGKKYNKYIKIEKLKKVAARFVSYIPKFESFCIKPHFDCGIPMCLFNDEQLGKLYKLNSGNLYFGCSPAFDIGPDMSVWSCFSMSNYQKKSLYEFNSINEIYDYYFEVHQKIRVEAGGIFEECDNCKYRNSRLCSGGCLAHNLTHFMNEPKLRFKEVYPDE